MNTIPKILSLSLIVALHGPGLHAVPPLQFPPDADLVDVTAYGAKPNDQQDDTASIQRAFNENSGNGSVIFLPAGEYLISDTIKWPGRRSFNCLQGAGREHTVLRLIDNAPGYDNSAKPKNMIWTGGPPAQRFRNSVRDLTIDCGKGNPGAIGLNFCANNQGGVFEVTIRSGEDGSQPGTHGLALDESEVGPLLVKRVEIIGFDLGIRVRSTVNSVTLEDIKLRGQRVAGIDNLNNYVFARKVESVNAVPAVVNDGKDGIVTLLDCKLSGQGKASEIAAMQNRNPYSTLYVRNVEVTGYAEAISNNVQPSVPAGRVDEWASGPRIGLFPGEVRSLNLPIQETPTVPHDPLNQWVSPAKFGGYPGDGKDDTAAIQKAIDSGATTVYLTRAPRQKGSNMAYDISDSIHIRGKVRRIVGLEASFEVTKSLASHPEKPVFLFEDGAPPVVVMERLRFSFLRFKNPAFLHQSKRTLVLSSFSELHAPRITGPGTLFLDDTVGEELYVGPGATVFARQLNIEGNEMKMINDGGQLWVMGLKTECRSPIARTAKGGKTEIVGAHLYKCKESGVDQISYVIEDGGQQSLAGMGEYVWDPKFATETVVQETRQGETRSLVKRQAPPHGNSVVLPLFAGFPTETKTAAVPTPQVKIAEATAGSLLMKFGSEEGTAPPEGGFLVSCNGQLVGRFLGEMRQRNLQPDTEYPYQITAFDRFGNSSTPLEFRARTLLDTVPPTVPGYFRTLYLTDQLVHLIWEASKDEIAMKGYLIERGTEGGKSFEPVFTQSCEFRDEYATKGLDYTYRVIAIDSNGNRSTPAELKLKVPDHPPYSVKQEAERYDAKQGSVKKTWYVYDLGHGGWINYKSIELGRDKPFDQITLRYGAPSDRAGAIAKVLLDPVIEERGDKKTLKGGEQIAEFVLVSTGGWETFKSFTLPARINKPGKHDLFVVLERGSAREGNALLNLDWFEVGYANPPKN